MTDEPAIQNTEQPDSKALPKKKKRTPAWRILLRMSICFYIIWLCLGLFFARQLRADIIHLSDIAISSQFAVSLDIGTSSPLL